ncbi:MAG: hypothetical protein WB542_18115 [Polaromonas sp.]
MGETTTDTAASGQSSWETWIQNIGGQVIGAATAAQYTQPYDIQRMKIQALGQQGYYTEGKPGIQQAPSGISPVMIIGGAMLLMVVLLTRGKA